MIRPGEITGMRLSDVDGARLSHCTLITAVPGPPRFVNEPLPRAPAVLYTIAIRSYVTGGYGNAICVVRETASFLA